MGCFIAGGFATLVYNIIKLNQVFAETSRFVGANKFLTFFCKQIRIVCNGVNLSALLSHDGHRFNIPRPIYSRIVTVNLVLGMATMYFAWVCLKNFNNGLNAH